MLHKWIQPEIEKILRKNQNSFWRNQSTISHILTIHQIIERVHAKNLKATLLSKDFSITFNSIHRGKMEQIQLAYGFPKETVITIMMFYKNMKALVYSPDSNTNFFNIVTGVLQGDTLVAYMFII